MVAIGRAYVSSLSDHVAGDLNKFFDAVHHADAELLELLKGRLAGVGLAEGISPKQEAEIELQAAMDQWRETRTNLQQRGETFLSDTLAIASELDATDQMRELINKRWLDADADFQARIIIAFGEATEGLSNTPNPEFVVDQATVDAILNRIMNAPDGKRQGRELINYYRRLVDIAWFENHLPDYDRQLARKALPAFKEDILRGLAPEAQKAFIEASDNQMDGVPFFGVGSLQWIIQEQNVVASDLIDFIVRPEFAHLLPTHLTMLDDGVLTDIRFAVLRSLIRSRRSVPEQSDTQSLLHLQELGDRSVDILLKSDELRLLYDAENDYVSIEMMVARIMNS